MNKVLLILSSIFLIACSSDPSSHELKLNNGKKWEINAEMTPHIEKGMEILSDYVDNGGTDYHALADQLEKQNWQLIKSCTMEGESHDQLHNWLHPHMALLDELEDAETEEAASVKIESLLTSFETYRTHFK